MTALDRVYASVNQRVPSALDGWDSQLSRWLQEYLVLAGGVEVLEIVLDSAAFLFDMQHERVALAFAVSTPKLHARDSSRMRGFPDVNVGVQQVLGSDAKAYDRGHYLGHASGGELDINLFPHERALNRGWSREGKEFRRLERIAAAHAGTFFYHRPLYTDASWIPTSLDFGVLASSGVWESGQFANR